MKLLFKPVRIQARGFGFTVDRQTVAVITNEREMKDFYQVEDWYPRLDFRRYILLGIHRGWCDSGGHSIDVEQIECCGNQVIVRCRCTDHRPEDLVTLVATNPQQMILIERSGLPRSGKLKFVLVDQNGKALAEREAVVQPVG